MTTKKLKPFDLEAAKKGVPVVTRQGWPVRIICFDAGVYATPSSKDDLVCLVTYPAGDVGVVAYQLNGKYFVGGTMSNSDLFMAPIKKSGFVNIYPNSRFTPYPQVYFYVTKELADKHATPNRIACVPIEWEE